MLQMVRMCPGGRSNTSWIEFGHKGTGDLPWPVLGNTSDRVQK